MIEREIEINKLQWNVWRHERKRVKRDQKFKHAFYLCSMCSQTYILLRVCNFKTIE